MEFHPEEERKMRIDPRLLSQHNDVAATQRKREADALKPSAPVSGPAAQVSLSGPGEALQRFGAVLGKSEVNRADLVARLKAEVDAGAYQPSGESIAKAILDRDADAVDVDALR